LSIACAAATIQGVAITPGRGIPEEEPAQNPAAGLTSPDPRVPAAAEPGPLSAPPPGILPAQSRTVGHPRARHRATPRQAAIPGPQAAATPPRAGKECPEFSECPATPDYTILKQTLAEAGPAADRQMAYFYSVLFTAHPELRAMFPLAMDEQRRALSAALARCAWSMDNQQSLREYLAQLGRDHRKYGVQEQHYQVFGETLATALRMLNGASWSHETAAAWHTAVSHVCSVMAAAARDAADEPPWWVAEVIRHERRRPDLAVLTIRPGEPFPYQPGQYLSVQVLPRPRVWRNYSIANAPRADGTLDLHIRAIPGGQVSTTLVQDTGAGDTILLGPARGSMVVDHSSARDILCIAGGTGFAPIKAIIEGLAARPGGGAARRIRLFAGARRRADLYDLPDLARLESQCARLDVVTALSDEPGACGPHGLVPDVVRQQASWQDCDVFVSGPPGMVRATLRALAHRASGEHLYCDPYDQADTRLPD
jgi:NAD(P)H-flavin reductase/hemoglobin-like flavoprotein